MGRKSLREPRQKEIIIAFYELAKKEGLENASIAKTAQLINIQPSLIMHYFKTKEYLLYGLVEYILDKYLLIFDVKGKNTISSLEELIKVIERLFSNKWNLLFDDSVSYSCYALTFRDKTIQGRYRIVLKALRSRLSALISRCIANGEIEVKNAETTADLIFVLVDGAYYYLSLIRDKKEYGENLKRYKDHAISLLDISV
ncbi:TetR/AcrR family transcriptional regulator [Arachidicoccus terrestris]|uniref:TetR/AcrR family transcriptional regulator n=1 Tax=Arachidicoccus terrestris TaxID=2875539 RepID=UPI001CC7CCF5|nr:TetR/AcrR family transcriptional regulator [Arachidicoccus terrestris]UAY55342.1 TetR/AcrR family transcriptional regulator [Arachidicoccus terrestris]